jgi:hypothetical protein
MINIASGGRDGMRSQQVLGLVIFLAGLVLLYLLRGTVYQLILLAIEFLGVVLAVILIVVGLGMLLFGGRRWAWTTRF